MKIFHFPAKQEILDALPANCTTFCDSETNEKIAKVLAGKIGTERSVKQLLWDTRHYDLDLGLTKDSDLIFERNWMQVIGNYAYTKPAVIKEPVKPTSSQLAIVEIGAVIAIACIATLIFTRLSDYYTVHSWR